MFKMSIQRFTCSAGLLISVASLNKEPQKLLLDNLSFTLFSIYLDCTKLDLRVFYLQKQMVSTCTEMQVSDTQIQSCYTPCSWHNHLALTVPFGTTDTIQQIHLLEAVIDHLRQAINLQNFQKCDLFFPYVSVAVDPQLLPCLVLCLHFQQPVMTDLSIVNEDCDCQRI